LRFWEIEHSRLHRALSNHEVTKFLLQLNRLLKSRVELDDALGFAVDEQKNRVLSFLLCQMHEDLWNGLSLSSTLSVTAPFQKILEKWLKLWKVLEGLPEVLEMLLDFYQFQKSIIQEQNV
jgi:type II secretory pathway component PulF